MIRTKDELLNAVRALLPDDSTDEVLALLEDITDTMDNATDPEDWHGKYDALDKEWRERYKARFFANPEENNSEEDAQPEDNIDEEPTTFEDLFE